MSLDRCQYFESCNKHLNHTRFNLNSNEKFKSNFSTFICQQEIHVLTCSTVLTTQHFLLHATRLHAIFNPNIDCLVKATNEFYWTLFVVLFHHIRVQDESNSSKLFELLEKQQNRQRQRTPHPRTKNQLFSLSHSKLILNYSSQAKITHQPSLVN